MSGKQLIIIGGANGSGKTTFATKYFNEIGLEFLNADNIAKTLEEKNVKSPMVAAGRVFFDRLHTYLSQDRSFIVETTLSGTYINKVTQKARDRGYKVKLVYIYLDSPEVCIDRVKARVRKGGHHVSMEDVRRRFHRSFDNFWNGMTSLVNSWILVYNGQNGFQQVALSNNGSYSIENEYLFNKFIDLINNEKG